MNTPFGSPSSSGAFRLRCIMRLSVDFDGRAAAATNDKFAEQLFMTRDVTSSLATARSFDQRINVNHPSKSKLVKKLVLEQSGHEVTLEQFRATATIPRQKVKYRQVTARLNTIMDTYFDVPNDDYLRGIAHNL